MDGTHGLRMGYSAPGIFQSAQKLPPQQAFGACKMIANFPGTLVFLTTIGCGIMAGVFFAFSVFVKQALGQLPTGQAISAMQSINTTIVRSLFMIVFLGTAICSIALIICSALYWEGDQAIYAGAGSALYLVGVIFVTIFFNVPLNDSLASLNVTNNINETVWTEYANPWIAWNHVRTTAAVVSTIMLLTAALTGL